MSTFHSRCPSCGGMNRLPVERVSDSPNCGKCKSDLFDGAPIEGTNDNFTHLLQSDQPVVVDFLGTMVQSLCRFCSCFPRCRSRAQRQSPFH